MRVLYCLAFLLLICGRPQPITAETTTNTPPQPSTRVLIHDTICHWETNNGRSGIYRCEDDSTDPLTLHQSQSARIINQRILLYSRRKQHDNRFAADNLSRGVIRVITLENQTACTLTANRQAYDPFRYICEDGRIVTHLKDGGDGRWAVRTNALPRWHLVDSIKLDFKRLEIDTYWDIRPGMSEQDVNWLLLNDGFERIWAQEITIGKHEYKSVHFRLRNTYRVPEMLFLVFSATEDENFRLVKNAPLRYGYLSEVLFDRWQDINNDGLPEMTVQYLHGGTSGVYPITILQLRNGEAHNITPRLGKPERHDWVDEIRDLDGDGIDELIVWDRWFQTMGGCNACGFTFHWIYVWDGKKYVERSADFPHYYQEQIAQLTKIVNVGRYTPQMLGELFILMSLVGEQERGWEMLADNWQHDEWEYYAPYYDAFAKRAGVD